jgi:hypothetical protein
MNFQQIVLIVSGIFIVIFTIITIYSVSNLKNQNATTYVANCPDYWSDTNNDGTQCVNLGINNSTNNCSINNFSGSICEKYNKVLQCPGVVWDGITYGNSQNIKNCKL